MATQVTNRLEYENRGLVRDALNTCTPVPSCCSIDASSICNSNGWSTMLCTVHAGGGGGGVRMHCACNISAIHRHDGVHVVLSTEAHSWCATRTHTAAGTHLLRFPHPAWRYNVPGMC